MTVTCPHCQTENEHDVLQNINIDQNPELRESVQDLSCFRVQCPNCSEQFLAVHDTLYHDMAGEFMVWLWPNTEEALPKASFEPLSGYRLRIVESLNDFREKIAVLEAGLDDRAIEMMKLLLFMQLRHDLDIVEVLFHEMDERTGDFRFVGVLSDGAEQYVAMPNDIYQKLRGDIEQFLYTPSFDFIKIDLAWAKEMMELMQQMN